MKKFIKRLFCKHDYVTVDSHMEHGGMCKIITCECIKCGKVRVYVI